jgi:SAM-dependent methyltransferase
MTSASARTVDWASWLRRWDAQQALYLPAWENRFQTMLDVLDVVLPDGFTAIDLACGPGSISRRLLARFPNAHAIAVDIDPVLLELGRSTLGHAGGRLRWVEVDLSQEEWLDGLGEPRVDAVLSTTALHWLPAEHVVRLYRQLFELVRPGGVVMNGEYMDYPPSMEVLRHVTQTLRARRTERAQTSGGAEDWAGWWESLSGEPGLKDLFVERGRRFAGRPAKPTSAGYRLQEAALLEAGFKEVGVIWQDLHNRVLAAIR